MSQPTLELEEAEDINAGLEANLRNSIDEAKAQVEISKESASQSKLAPIMSKLEPVYQRMLKRKDEKDDLTLEEYRNLTGKDMPAHLIQDRFGRKYVSWENAMDNIAAEYGYDNSEEMKADLEREVAQKGKMKQAENLLATSQESLDRIEKERINEQLRIRPEPRQIDPSIATVGGISTDTVKTQEQPIIEPSRETINDEISEPIIVSGSNVISQPTANELKYILFRTSKGLLTKEEKAQLNELATKYPEWAAKQKDLFTETIVPVGETITTTPTTIESHDGKKTANVTTKTLQYKTTYAVPSQGSVRIRNAVNRIAREEKAKETNITPNGLGKQERPDLAIGGLKVYLVNENFIRKNYEMNYTKSASDKTMPMVIPQDEIWLSRGLPEVEIYQNLLRAYLARELMKQGKERYEAQKDADKIADNYRNALGALKMEIQRHQEKNKPPVVYQTGKQRLTSQGALDRRISQAMPKSIMNDKRFWQEEKPKKKEQPHKSQSPTSNTYLGMELLPVQI